jgi:hypothetical protein
MVFPERDDANPEIERMWAWKRIDQLQKKADRAGSRDAVIAEIVNLGETYSIVSEYTSFLVLENDAEYQRWQIERRNVRRLGRDRTAQASREETLRLLRERALSDIGPAAAAKPAALPPEQLASATPAQPRPGTPAANPATAPTQPRNQGRSIDLDIGTGPVGPLFVALAAWMARRRQRRLAA